MNSAAVLAAFALNGLLQGSWAARVPALATQVHAGPGGLGLALLGTPIGLILAAPFTGRLCVAFGSRRVVLISSIVASLALPLLGLVHTIPLLAGSLLLLGASAGMLDVSMNIPAVALVRQLDRPLMPVFHAAYSFGGLAGALGASLAARVDWSPIHQFLLVSSVGIVAMAALGWAVPGARPAPSSGGRRRPSIAPFRRPVLWLLAVIVLCSAIGEGASSDWSALFLVRERGLAQATAATGFAAFSIAMAVTRLTGERWERRWGSYRVVACGGILAALGFFAAALIPVWFAGYLGFVLVGIGLAFAFPVTLGLAGVAGHRLDGSGGEHEIGFVTTIAYGGFLAGPPVIGFIAQATNLAVAIGLVGLVVAAMLPVALAAQRSLGREVAKVTASTH
ncbi:MAG TPA: MFS transporter [Pseudonocardiaceae bacterium]|jgi:MFS family permease|nr:MFS transporter [Pseudonocardiaceae bacterium]